MPVDEKSSYLHMPLPHEANTLDQDLKRLRAAFDNLDSHAHNSDAAQAALKSELASKSRELAARDDMLRETLESASADLRAHLAAENPHHIPTASPDTPGLARPDNVTCSVSDAGVLSVRGEELAFTGYPTEFRSFFEQNPPQGWAVRNGATLENADRAYPALWAALHAEKNAWKCRSLEEWSALSAAAGGCGGAPFFVLDESAKTIRLPDTRGDYARDAGSGFLEAVGAWHGDAIRDMSGSADFGPSWLYGASGVFSATGSNPTASASVVGSGPRALGFAASRVVPTASENRPRSYGLLGCVYVGSPV